MLSCCMEHILTKDALYRLSYISIGNEQYFSMILLILQPLLPNFLKKFSARKNQNRVDFFLTLGYNRRVYKGDEGNQRVRTPQESRRSVRAGGLWRCFLLPELRG